MIPVFNDLKFKKHPLGKGWAGFYNFENGYRISVTCGETMYCTPKLYLKSPGDYSEFEIAILGPDDEWATKEILPNSEEDVIGWLPREKVTEIMELIQNHK